MLTSLRALGAGTALAAAVLLPALARGALAASPTLTVSGEATVVRQPDRATVNVTLVTNNDNAQTATSANNAAYSSLLARMRALGISESSIRTASYDLEFVAKPDPNAQYKPPRTGFVVTRRLQITLDDLSAVGRAIDAALSAGTAQIDGVAFGLRDERAAYADALGAAMGDAAAQAAALAKAGHVHLGPIQSIDATRAAGIVTPLAVTLRAEAPIPTQIPPSGVQVHASVKVSYALQP